MKYHDVSKIEIKLRINGMDYVDLVYPRTLLVDFIRDQFGLTGTHIGCDTGHCGACTVLLNGKSVKSCMVLAVQANNSDVTTVEGFSKLQELTPIQQAFKENHGLQCGFCTPGMLIAATFLLERNPNPSEEQIRKGIDGNLCRCTGYQNIVKSIEAAATTIIRERS